MIRADKGDKGDGVSPYPPLSPFTGKQSNNGDILYTSVLYHDYEEELWRDKGDKGDNVERVCLIPGFEIIVPAKSLVKYSFYHLPTYFLNYSKA